MKYLMMVGMMLGWATASAPACAELKIMTTTATFADVARQIGGDKVTVRSVMKGPENAHKVLAKPTEMLFLNKADLFVHSGLDAEPWRDNFLKGARNPKVMPGKAGNVDMSAGIDLRDVPQGRVDRSQGDVHAFGDPHYSMNPIHVAKMSATLAKAMAEADPKNADLYRANARRLVTEMFALHEELKGKVAAVGEVKVATFHRAWGYFADAFGLKVTATIEPKPMVTPSPGEVKRVVETLKREGVKVVVVETYNSVDLARSVAEAAGAKLLVLPDQVNGMEGVDSVQKLFRYDVEKIVEALK